MTFAAQIPYVGDATGRKVGDIFYGPAAPDVSYLQADGTQVLASDYGTLQLAGWNVLNQTGLQNADSNTTTSVSGYAVVGTDIFFGYLNLYHIFKKTSPFGSIVTVKTDPLNLFGAAGGAGVQTFYYLGVVNGYHFASYTYDDGTGGVGSGWGYSPQNNPGGTWTSGGTGTSADQLYSVCLSPTGRLIYASGSHVYYGPTSGAAGGSLSAGISSGGTWVQVFTVGSNVYAVTNSGKWAKSTDGGVTWTTYTPFNAGVGGQTVYDPVSGKFFGVDSSNDIVSASDPTSAWTTEVAGGSYFSNCAVIATALGNIVVIGSSKIAVRGVQYAGWYVESLTATFNNAARIFAAQYSGYIIMSDSSRHKLIGDVDTRFNLPKLADVGGWHGYIKAR